MAMENCCSIHVHVLFFFSEKKELFGLLFIEKSFHAIPYGSVRYSIYGCSEAVTQDQARSSLRRPSVSIPAALKTPKASDLTRKRKVDCIPPPKGKRRACGEGSSEPKTVCPRERERISGRVLDCDGRELGNFSVFFKIQYVCVCNKLCVFAIIKTSFELNNRS